MATMTLTQRQLNASVAAPVPIEVLAGGKPTPPVILALDLGQRTGWAVRNRDGAIASGVQEFRPGRFDGGGMIWLRFRGWLQEINETSGGVGVVVFEEVRRHLGTSAAHASAVTSRISPPGRKPTASRTRASRSAPSSDTSPARATPTSGRSSPR